jgi:hypothetical protein
MKGLRVKGCEVADERVTYERLWSSWWMSGWCASEMKGWQVAVADEWVTNERVAGGWAGKVLEIFQMFPPHSLQSGLKSFILLAKYYKKSRDKGEFQERVSSFTIFLQYLITQEGSLIYLFLAIPHCSGRPPYLPSSGNSDCSGRLPHLSCSCHISLLRFRLHISSSGQYLTPQHECHLPAIRRWLGLFLYLSSSCNITMLRRDSSFMYPSLQ